MISAHSRRAVRELTRRRARSVLSVLTIASAVAGIWLFSIPGSVDASLQARTNADAMHTARIAPTAADLTEAQLAELRGVDNVAALDVRTLGRTLMRIGDRTQGVVLVGVEDFSEQAVNIVSVEEGALPTGTGQVVTDRENARTGRYPGVVGDSVELASPSGGWSTYRVVGRGGTLRYSIEVADDVPFLYLSNTDVQRIMGYPAPNSIDVLASDLSPAAVEGMVDEVRTRLGQQVPNIAYWDVLEVWEKGAWPGSDDFDNFLVVFYVIAAVALVSALVLIFTTMNTIVREQTREIGIMKAIGGTPRRISLGYLRLALSLGVLGTILGTIIGIPLSNAVMGFMIREFGGTSVGWRVSWIAVGISLVVGLAGTVLAAGPALRRAGRVTVRTAIDDHGVVGTFGLGTLDQIASRPTFLARRSQLGLRNAARRPGRSLATAIPIGLAVGTMLAFGAVLVTAVNEDENSFDLEGGDITVWNQGGRGLGGEVAALMESVPEVEFAHQMIYSVVEFDGEHNVWGLPAVSTYRPEVVAGRWFSEEEADAGAPVVVMGDAAATVSGTRVGDAITVETRRGPVDLEVVGIDGQLVNNGTGMFLPFRTVLDYEGWTTGNYWVRTTSPDPETVIAAADGIHRVMRQSGYDIGSNLRYLDRRANEAQNRLIVAVVMGMGLPIVAIGMIGLVSAMTSNVVDRTREIGILRSIGARRRDLRAMFRAEGLVIALVGWLIGIPVGYLLGRLIIWVVENQFNTGFTFTYPLWPILVALVVTVVVTLTALRLPLRRVIRMHPGEALRYE